MKKCFSRIITTALSAVIMLSIVSCGKPTVKQNDAGSTPIATPPNTSGMTVDQILKTGNYIKPIDNIKFPISKKPITITILKPQVQDDAEYKNMPLLQDYEKKTNIHITWNCPPDTDFNTKYKLLMSSGHLPDAIIGMPEGDIETYGQQGAIIDLKSLIDKYMPNLKSEIDKDKQIKKIITSDEGKVYSLPEINQFVTGNNVMMVRKDWLDKYNLKMPETTDDWYNVLKTFKQKNPKCWPFSGYGQPAALGARELIAAWGICPDDGFYLASGNVQPKDNKIHFGAIEPLFKEGLTWVANLYKEGLIDPEIVTNDDKAFDAEVMQDKVGAWRGWVNGDMQVLNDTAKKNGKTDLNVQEAPIMKGPHGDQVHFWQNSLGNSNAFVITRNNKYAKETAEWADYWYSTVGRTFVYGIENVTYKIGSDGQPHWTDWVLNNPNAKTVNQARGSQCFGRGLWPCVFQPWSLTAATVAPYIEESRKKYRKPELMVEALPEGLSFSKSENDTITSKMTDINTKVDEWVANFITGKKPLSDWDKYVSEVKAAGIQQIMDIYNNSYVRYQKR